MGTSAFIVVETMVVWLVWRVVYSGHSSRATWKHDGCKWRIPARHSGKSSKLLEANC